MLPLGGSLSLGKIQPPVKHKTPYPAGGVDIIFHYHSKSPAAALQVAAATATQHVRDTAAARLAFVPLNHRETKLIIPTPSLPLETSGKRLLAREYRCTFSFAQCKTIFFCQNVFVDYGLIIISNLCPQYSHYYALVMPTLQCISSVFVSLHHALQYQNGCNLRKPEELQ